MKNKIPQSPTDLERQISSLCEDFSRELDALATGDFLREGILKEAINTLVWSVADRMSDQREALAEALEHLPDLIRDELAKEPTD
ncbi:MAG: hypothetical protein K0R64_2995 [Novosphingobium lindaniclasticum]|uniref:hypothetical protein n=1 Tax=Novosphingobium lindaniclasticum TaxID=1329895 RepID=UPI0024093AEB|nr:hypothetical protein [Novosphingobium lindaniclasticum]MDF2640011.1 hypothetical protein [Novosphingobium lindaniclasticum]